MILVFTLERLVKEKINKKIGLFFRKPLLIPRIGRKPRHNFSTNLALCHWSMQEIFA
jgi:hypothetical protein